MNVQAENAKILERFTQYLDRVLPANMQGRVEPTEWGDYLLVRENEPRFSLWLYDGKGYRFCANMTTERLQELAKVVATELGLGLFVKPTASVPIIFKTCERCSSQFLHCGSRFCRPCRKQIDREKGKLRRDNKRAEELAKSKVRIEDWEPKGETDRLLQDGAELKAKALRK